MNKRQITKALKGICKPIQSLDDDGYEFCKIFEAERGKDKELVVVKVYDLELTPKSMLDDYGRVREMNLHKYVTNNRFPKHLDSGFAEADGKRFAYIVRNYIPDAVTLTEYIHNHGPLELNDGTKCWMLDLVAAIYDLEQMKGVDGHFNLCPDNIMVSDGTLYITGLTHLGPKAVGAPLFETSGLSIKYRPQESFMGYFAPCTDVYALSLVFCYMLTGKYPYDLVGKARSMFDTMDGPEKDRRLAFKLVLKEARKEPPVIEISNSKLKLLLSRNLSNKVCVRDSDAKEFYNSLCAALDVDLEPLDDSVPDDDSK